MANDPSPAPPNDRLERAIAAIDAVNAEDPNRIVVGGVEAPKELAHARLMTDWIERLRPEPSEALRLAARAHHIARWRFPRAAYPDGRAGYLRWRTALYDEHARLAAEILRGVGYDEDTIARVDELLHKKHLTKREPEVQAQEDALCLVFMETQFHELAARTPRDKMVDIVRKTLRKMSPAGLTHAQALPWSEPDLAIVRDALAALPPA